MAKVIAIIAILAVLSLCSASMAAQLHWTGLGSGIGGYYNSPPDSGIGYGLTGYHENWACEIVFDSVTGLSGYADGSALVTFCVEWDEGLIGEDIFNATVNAGAVNGGVGGQTTTNFDPLSDQSAWLYSEYMSGNTFGIADLNRRAAVVQEGIWSLENELTWSTDYAETTGVISSANAAVAAGWTNQTVRVLNVTWEDGRNGQDVLAIVPEPSSIVVLLGAFGSLCAFKRRKA